jgi:diaminopimelate decarboxylase
MSRSAHPAGPRHADVLPEAHHATAPSDVNALDPAIWPATAERRDGVVRLGGRSVVDLVREHGTPALFLDEDDLRGRARAYRSSFADLDVYYAGKAFLCTSVARWIDEEGLGLDVCSGGELAVALAAGFPTERIAMHGNNKSPAELLRRDRAARCDRRGVRPGAARPGPGDGRRRGAHPRVHRHGARGPEVRVLAA